MLQIKIRKKRQQMPIQVLRNITDTLQHFKMTLPLFQVLRESLPIPLSFCHIQ